MKKLNKKNYGQKYTIEAYACTCACWCNQCKCAGINFFSFGSNNSSNGHNYPTNASY